MTKRILIVSNDATQRLALNQILTKPEYTIIAKNPNTTEAIALSQEQPPDIAIIDHTPPDLDGIALTKKLSNLIPSEFNNNPLTHNIITKLTYTATILLSTYYDQQTLQAATETDIFAFLLKPIQEHELIPTLEIAYARLTDLRTTQEKLLTHKLIERAIGLLIEKFQLTHQEALRKIQKASMHKQISMRKVAEMILTRQDI